MASASMLPALLIFSIFFTDLLSLSADSSTQPKIHPTKETIRIRREECEHGTYDHEGKSCCKCGPGQRVEQHCSVSPSDGTCTHCGSNTYSIEPNDGTTCEKCTSCDHLDANLEVAQPCTPGRNTVCQCKKDHYCTGSCKTCSRCQICPHGVEKACTNTSDAVCRSGSGSTAIYATVIPIVIVAVVAIVLGVYFWKKRRQRMRGPGSSGEDGQETQPLKDIPEVPLEVFETLLPDIAEELGWGVMKEVAIKSRIKDGTIESCENNHPRNNQEQTLELLKNWVNMQGKGAPRKLVEILDKCGKRGKAEKVIDILSRTSPV